MKEKFKDYINNNHSFDKKTMLGVLCLVIVIAGIFGWTYETVLYYFNGGMKEWYWRGGNFLPWINIYATGSIFIYFLTYKYRKSPLKVFFISLFTCGILEYIAGLGVYTIGNGLRYWDYNTEILNFGNIGGFICLRSVLFFAFSGLFLIYVIIPFCFNLAKKMNKKTFLIISITLCSIFLVDELYNLIFSKILSFPGARDFHEWLGCKFVKFK